MKVEKIEGTLMEVDEDNNQVAITPSQSKDRQLYNVDGDYMKKEKKTLEDLLLDTVYATLHDNIISEIAKKNPEDTKPPSEGPATKP
jgi:hypothetical protein